MATKQTQNDKAVFFDMVQSNNAARVRLWLLHNPKAAEEIETRMVTYEHLDTEAFKKINPLKKVPAFVRSDGSPFYESQVILQFLEHKYNHYTKFVPETPEDRMLMDFMIRLHDLYVASPNSSMPGFSHTQGAMYLAPVPTPFCPPERCISRPDRAKKIQELWEQLERLNGLMKGPYLLGESLTLADFAWYPTTIFMEFCLGRIFHWPDIFRDPQHLPKFSAWWTRLTDSHPEFAKVRKDIYDVFAQKYEEGQFATIEEEVKDSSYQWRFPVQWNEPFLAALDYKEPQPEGKARVGEYIDTFGNELEDAHVQKQVVMYDGRMLHPPATLESKGFEFVNFPSVLLSVPKAMTATSIAIPAQCSKGSDKLFLSDDTNREIYYEEMKDLIQQQTGCSEVYIFDHLDHVVRQSAGACSCSSCYSDSVHCDCTRTVSAPWRPTHPEFDFGQEGENVQKLMDIRRYAFINVWRSVDAQHPVLQWPLAVCDASSVPLEDRNRCKLHSPNRTGENYVLHFSPEHKWYTYSKMTHDECLLFKVFDSRPDGTRFVFRSTFDDPRGGFKAPPRHSVEVRAIAVW